MKGGGIGEGDRVETPRGPGVVTKITREARFVLGEWEDEALVVVELDRDSFEVGDPPRNVRPVFYAKQVRPEAER